MPVVNGYVHFGGTQPETAALANVLASRGVSMPGVDRPYSEAMLLGIGGGLGAGYILWEFNEHKVQVLVLGFRHRWQYSAGYLADLCARIGVGARVFETSGSKAAASALADALERGIAPVAWVDWAHMPYWHLPAALKAHFNHVLAICGRDGDDLLVDDLGARPFRVDAALMAQARARIGSDKNRLLLVESAASNASDLPAMIRAGLETCVAHLSAKSDSFSLPAIRKWARLLTDDKNAKGWLKVFATGRGVYATLSSMYEGIELNGTGGGGLRGLYAEFLDEAAGLLDAPALLAAATGYRACAEAWTAAADAALPDDVAPFAETKRLLQRKYALMRTQGDDAAEEMAAIAARLGVLFSANNRECPLDAAGRMALFAAIAERLQAVYAAELEALDGLRQAL